MIVAEVDALEEEVNGDALEEEVDAMLDGGLSLALNQAFDGERDEGASDRDAQPPQEMDATSDTIVQNEEAPLRAGELRAGRGLSALRRDSAAGGLVSQVRRSVAAASERPYEDADIIGVIGPYDVLGELGRGGMGIVYKGYEPHLRRYVAIKTILGHENGSPIMVARFINEAMLAARLQHPNITRIYDSGETDEGVSYFAMEFIEGRDLGHFLDQGLSRSQARAPQTITGTQAQQRRETLANLEGGKLSLHIALSIIEKAARALHYAHEQGIVHRDVKPDNLLIDDRLEPHWTDFGIAKAMVDDNLGLTADGDVMGTPYYMSPEQASGDLRLIGPRSDVYSLGAMLYHVIAGQEAFGGDNVMEILFQVASDDPPKKPSAVVASKGWPALSIELETICLKAMEKAPKQRYDSAQAFADDLRCFLDGEPISARPLTPLQRLRRQLKRNRPVLLSILIAASLVVTVVTAFGLSLAGNIEQTSASLRTLDEREALSQAATLEQAIRVNMLQGRADLARGLVHELEKNKTVSSIEVARVDRTVAYSDGVTKQQVQNRLQRDAVRAEIAKKAPELVKEVRLIEVLEETALRNIEKDLAGSAPSFDRVQVDDSQWAQVLAQKTPVTYEERLGDGRQQLVVLKPIANSEKCRFCHGGGDSDLYGADDLRAVLVLRRPLDTVQETIDENSRSTWSIAGATSVFVLLVLFGIGKVFGIGLGKGRAA